MTFLRQLSPTLRAEIQLAAAQSIPDSSFTAVSWDTSNFDNGSFWSAGAPTNIVIPNAGKYFICTEGHFVANASGWRFWRIRKTVGSGTGTVASSGLTSSSQPSNETWHHIARLFDCAAGDTFQIQCYQNSGGPLNISGSSASPNSGAPIFVDIFRL